MLLPARRELTHRTVGGEVLVRDPQSGQVHFLNGTAALIWECCDGVTSLEECERRVRAAFEAPEGVDVAGDIRETVAGFAAKGLVNEPGAPA